MATARIPPTLRGLTDGAREVEIRAATVGALLDELEARHPGLRARLRGPDGSLHPFLSIFVAGEDIRLRAGLATPLHDGDEVLIVPAVTGGC